MKIIKSEKLKKPQGYLEYWIKDKDTGEIIKHGKGKNIVVNAGLNGLVQGMIDGSFIIDTIKIGTTNTAFVSNSTDLTTPVQTLSLSGSERTTATVGKIIISKNFSISGAQDIQEIGIFSGSTAWALTSAIDAQLNNQVLFTQWTIDFSDIT